MKNNTSESNDTVKVETFFKDSKLTEKLVPTNAFLCLACVILNVLILYRYSKQLKKIVPILYFMNANVDIFIGVGVALQSVIFIPQIAADNEISGYLAAVSYMIVGVSIRVSTFVNLLLCIIRAINIISPFRYISRTSVVSATVCYTSLWVGLACWDEYWFHSGIGLTSGGLYVIKSLVLKPEVGFAAISTALGGSSSNLQNVLLLFVPAYLVPVVILVGSTSLQVIKLRQTSKVGTQIPGTSSKKRASVTILILSLIFLICNSASIIIWIIIYYEYLNLESSKTLDWFQLWLIYFSGTTLFLVSSTLTPLVLELRSSPGQTGRLGRGLRSVGSKLMTVSESLRRTTSSLQVANSLSG